MNNRTLARILGSSLIVTCSMVACSGTRMEHRPTIAATQANSIAQEIERNLAKRDFARAQVDAERLVAAQPREGAYRALLGRAYLANGRYLSARTAFEDAMTMGTTDTRTIVSLSLVHVALNDPAAARALLASHAGDLPAADFGLAMAMAGDPATGVRALSLAVREPGATAQVRQNLAYALALAGEWGQAQLIAGMDLSGRELQDRLAQWSAAAHQNAGAQRVAALIGVSPRADDEGLPERLALSASDPQMLAAASGATEVFADAAADAPPAQEEMTAGRDPDLRDTLYSELAEAAAAETSPTEGRQVMATADAPLIAAPTAPMREKPLQKHSPGMAASLAMPIEQSSEWVVQIGAYGDRAGTDHGWRRAVQRRLGVEGFRKTAGTVEVRGRLYHRLALSGFGDRGAADGFCRSLRAKGQACFVRRDAGVAEAIRMARSGTKASTKVASR